MRTPAFFGHDIDAQGHGFTRLGGGAVQRHGMHAGSATVDVAKGLRLLLPSMVTTGTARF